MQKSINDYLKTTVDIAEKAGRILMDEFLNVNIKRNKGVADYDIKIDIDKVVEKHIVSELKKEYKGHGFASEESEADNVGNDYVWYIDPLDGTNNFAIGITYFGLSIVLTFKGEPIISVIYNPVLKDMFTAGQGIGAYKNGKKIKYNGLERNLNECVVSFIRGHKTFKNKNLCEEGDRLYCEVVKLKPKRILTFWAPIIDYTLLIQGKIDLLISFEDEQQETYAGYLLCKEADVPILNLKRNRAFYKDTQLIFGHENLVRNVLERISKF